MRLLFYSCFFKYILMRKAMAEISTARTRYWYSRMLVGPDWSSSMIKKPVTTMYKRIITGSMNFCMVWVGFTNAALKKDTS